ncbi:hypothetical protein [Paraburkholderia tagetis]|uniref:Uncharacterized protein n=1 Tax=Paraburkholderia tagetis TaxID=2913261 RepID=A0A9X1UJA0_9BURK|nr:hypothetical protein [Paraburkholderia tagetis]MCG5076748.1 hypothetical protein [Paraburkholderia tagetis]
MRAVDILERAKTAARDHLAYARFVQESEVLHDNGDQDEQQKSAYSACWFELEIVNALALSEWESAGNPSDWAAAWNERYKRDAEELIANLCEILRQKKQ